MATNDEQFGEAFGRIRELETSIASHLATCDERGKQVQETLGRVEESVSEVKDGYDILKTERDEAKGALKGIRLVCVIAIGLIGLVSVILNILHYIE